MKKLLWLLLIATLPAFGAEVGGYPTASTPTGTERLLGDQNGVTVNFLMSQIAAFAASQLVSGTFTAGHCVNVAATSPSLAFGDAGAACGSGGGGGTPGGSNGQLQYNNGGSFGGFTLAGDCTLSVPNIVCTKTNGTSLGTFATQNYASPPPIGGTTPAAGNFTTGGFTSTFTLGGIIGSTQCLQVNSSGTTAGTGNPCNLASTLSGSPTNGQFWGYNGSVQGWYTPTGSGTVNSGTSGQLAYYASTGAAVSGASVGSGLTLSGGTLSATQAINAQTGTTYTIASTDAGKLVTFSNSSAVAVTLPQATGSFAAGFAFTAENLGAGLVTITPTTSTINGASSLTIPKNTGCSIVSDGTNYQIGACTAIRATNWLVTASSGTSLTPACTPGQPITIVTFTATGNASFNDPTGCTEGQRLLLKVTYSASITYTWASGSGGYHANASNPGAIPTSSGSTSGVDFFVFYADVANTRFDYLADAPAF